MITPKVEVEAKTRPSILPNSSPNHRISPPINYHKCSYSKAVSEGSSSDSSDSNYSSSTSSPVTNPSVSLENAVVLVRHFFHDDWQKTKHNLKKQIEEDFTYIAFHAEKALVNFKSLVPANLLCQNREGKWLIERDVQLHSTFKRQAAAIFDEFNSDSEQFLFEGMKAISSDYLTSTSRSRKSIDTEKTTALMTMLSCLQKQPMKLLQMITN
ncbi:hypothetical protein E5676_scaffold440G00100 [Cucumis melo var. makuwa]|uniref:Uncharacterized protein n=1 Tax=Cucumis melo var. makuwa TaxID=1194695 RepID=A0A5A7SQX4_CUCMM|nr:hypothetical protein E6C27_scaffold239G00240 [Cucumis melo var. makuwa]TYK22258.1 hypothetical protein E5676_scaffold440G00100 [Cucumis melo var. makuwa]